jgi:hypothetical protein
MTRAWIFQANPKRFDVDAFLARSPAESEWLVSRYGSEIGAGDRVFLWRSGTDPKLPPAGVFAEAVTVSTVRSLPDDSPSEFWSVPAEATAVRPRVRIALGRVANKREVIRREWWKNDPILADHLIMKMPNHTTFKLEGDHLSRLEQLWAKTGSDWTYAEAVAGLFAFVETYGHEVSRLRGSPVSDVSLKVGRPLPGVYNKVMNFRSLDPSDERKGLDGASAQDRTVWAEFYDPVVGVRSADVRTEYHRLWDGTPVSVDETVARHVQDSEAERLAKTMSLSELMARWASGRLRKPSRPSVSIGETRLFDRDPLVGAIARRRADFRCEVLGCTIPLFIGADGLRFVEVHHIHTLANGGDDTPENVASLCPLHHREAHFGEAGPKIAGLLRDVRRGTVSPDRKA